MKRITETQGLFGLIAIAVIAPLAVGVLINLTRRVRKKAEPVNNGKPLTTKWARGLSTSDGTVWQLQFCYEDGTPYRTTYVIGNSTHTKFVSDSTYPRGHETIDGEKAKAYPTEEAAETALLAMGSKPRPPMPEPEGGGGSNGWSDTPTGNPFGTMASAGGGIGSTDGRPSFNW